MAQIVQYNNDNNNYNHGMNINKVSIIMRCIGPRVCGVCGVCSVCVSTKTHSRAATRRRCATYS